MAEGAISAMPAIHGNGNGFLDKFSLASMEMALGLRDQDPAHYEPSMDSKEVAIHVPFYGNTHVA